MKSIQNKLTILAGFIAISLNLPAQQWVPVESGSSNDLLSVFCRPSGKCWAVGNLKILFSPDGGSTWQEQSPPLSNLNAFVPRKVQFLDDNVGFIAGSSFMNANMILKTLDGGNNWTLLDLTAISGGQRLNSIFFLNSSIGWACGASGRILRTTDGGETWQNVSLTTSIEFRDIHFADANNGKVVGGPLGQVYKTSDGGITWQREIDGDIYEYYTSVRLFGSNYCYLGSKRANESVAVGGIQRYINNNDRRYINPYPTTPKVNTMHWLNNNQGYIGCDEGIIYYANNAYSPSNNLLAPTWTKQETGEKSHIYGVSFVNTNVGVAVGQNGKIYRYNNTISTSTTPIVGQSVDLSANTTTYNWLRDQNGNLIGGVNPSGSDLGTTSWGFNYDQSPDYRTAIGFFGQTFQERGFFFPRNVVITPGSQPSGTNTKVRIYCTQQDIDGFLNYINQNYQQNYTATDLRVLKYNGENTDLNTANNSSNPSDYSIITPVLVSENGLFYFEFETPSFSEFSIILTAGAVETTYYYRDQDNDGFGSILDSIAGTSPPAGYVSVSGDCNDSNSNAFPGATEICNGIDDDCDGLIDEGCNFKFFRSSQSGNWANNTTWEYSVDSLEWLPAARIPLQTDSTILIRSGDTVTFSSFNVTADVLVIESDGTMIIENGSYLNLNVASNARPSLEVNGTLITQGNASIVGASGRSVLINGVCTMEGGGFLMSGGSQVYVSTSGTMNLISSSSQLVGSLKNAGTINWLSGDYAYGQSLHPVNYGTWNDSSNGIMNGRSGPQFKNWGVYRKLGGNSTFDGQNPFIVNRGIIKGSGRINLGKGDSSLNLGIIHPGDSIGKLTLAFNQPNTLSELNIQLGNVTGPGTGHDLLEMEGNLTLGGTLNVTELAPLANANFTIIRKISGTLSGTFTTTNLPLNYTIEYYADSVVLVKAPPVTPRNISIANPAAITEGNSGQKELKFVVRLNAASTGIVRVNYTTADSTATAGEDYTAMSGTIAIPAGILTDTIRVPILGDKLVEPVERFKVLLSNPVNGIITTGLAVGTINNDDVLPAIVLANYAIAEGTGRDSLLQLKLRLTASYPLPVTVNYSFADSTATSGQDYSMTAGSLTFSPGDTLAYIPVLVIGDGLDEPNEILHVSLSGPVNATLPTNARIRVTINDDDLLPALVLSNVSIPEGSRNDTTILVPVRLNRKYPETVSVYYTVSDSTATVQSDYIAYSSPIYFEPGDTVEFIPVAILADRIDEPNEIINFRFSTPVNLNIGTSLLRVTITDDDLLPAVQFSNTTIPEGNSGGFSTVSVQVRLSRAYPLPVTVNFQTSDSTATDGTDYTAVGGTLVFAPEDTLETISIPVFGDYLTEPTEIIKLRFSSPVNATASTTTTYRVALANDDVYPTISMTAPAITEGNTGSVNQAVTVRLSKRYPLPVSVQLATSDLTATGGQDYTAVNTTVTFPANGDTLQTVLVPVLGDLIDEVNETYRIQLTNPQYGVLAGTGIVNATINDNDPVPAIRVRDTIAAESDGTIQFTVSLNAPSGRLVTVNWAVQNGTAIAGQDYEAAAGGTVSFQPGETQQSIVVNLLTDALAESSETFSVVLSGAVNGTLTTSQGGDATGIGTIQNSVAISVNRRTNASDMIDRSLKESLQVKVLPNPSPNRFTLNLSGGSNEPIQLRVTDVLGRVVEARKLPAGTQTLQVGDSWINGNYILEVIQGTERKTVQLVKLR